MDDLLDPPACADMLINSACHLSGFEVHGIPALLGARYAIIDRRFAELPRRDPKRPVEKVLITLGMVDPDNVVCSAIEALNVLKKQGINLDVTVVTSTASPHLIAVRECIARSDGHVRLMLDARDMVAVLAETDLVVGAGGVSLMERLAAGVPSVSLVIAENQKLFVESAAAKGGTVYAGTASRLLPIEMAEIIRQLIADPLRRASMVQAGAHLIDGHGANRVANALVALSCSTQKVQDGHSEATNSVHFR